MEFNNPESTLPIIHLIRAGYVSGLLTKDDVVSWAENIILKEDKPDVFFIDLLLSSNKTKNEIVRYISEYLNFEKPSFSGRPLLGLLYRKYINNEISIKDAIEKLSQLSSEACFSDDEEVFIICVSNDFYLAEENIIGSIDDVKNSTELFLSLYKDYSIFESSMWPELDKIVNSALKNKAQYLFNNSFNKKDEAPKVIKPFWKFW